MIESGLKNDVRSSFDAKALYSAGTKDGISLGIAVGSFLLDRAPPVDLSLLDSFEGGVALGVALGVSLGTLLGKSLTLDFMSVPFLLELLFGSFVGNSLGMMALVVPGDGILSMLSSAILSSSFVIGVALGAHPHADLKAGSASMRHPIGGTAIKTSPAIRI